MENTKLTKPQQILFEVYDKGVQNEDCNLEEYLEKIKQALSISDVSVSVCSCEMPAKVKGKNECWRCKRPLKEFLQTEREKYIYIHQCSSPSMWYASKVGSVVAVHRVLKEEYLCREDAGFLNIVKKTDAVPVRFGTLGKGKKEADK